MELTPGSRKVYLRPGVTDLRKSINTLAIIDVVTSYSIRLYEVIRESKAKERQVIF
ncbi:hypothetical protein LEP1GSC188_3734 [Leptospira weilii serovar Topaz str. LT2116]|uniref:Uncharacterized protein n=1 Tax=Leptospira weilii serovar Topaz str. LT2116 TaxID=1088540 RepID=M3GUB4_9LEPT|nr:hypothetical protein LEP1GSC188_3734 [Leptospira weilii serovar Topaz str. LT2116]